MNIGVLCRSTVHFNKTIDYMIENKCLSEESIVRRGKYEVQCYQCTFSPIYVGKENSRGARFDLVIPEVEMPKIAELAEFKETSYSYARLKSYEV